MRGMGNSHLAGGTELSLWHTFADLLRQYFTQMRQEIGVRLVERVYVDDKPSKVGVVCVCVCGGGVGACICVCRAHSVYVHVLVDNKVVMRSLASECTLPLLSFVCSAFTIAFISCSVVAVLHKEALHGFESVWSRKLIIAMRADST